MIGGFSDEGVGIRQEGSSITTEGNIFFGVRWWAMIFHRMLVEIVIKTQEIFRYSELNKFIDRNGSS